MLRVPTSNCPLCHQEPDFDLYYEAKSGKWYAVAQCNEHKEVKMRMSAECSIIDFAQKWEELCVDIKEKGNENRGLPRAKGNGQVHAEGQPRPEKVETD